MTRAVRIGRVVGETLAIVTVGVFIGLGLAVVVRAFVALFAE